MIDDRGRGADGVDLSDVDADGDLDVVGGWEGSGHVRLYRNPGGPEIRQRWPRLDLRGGLATEDVEAAVAADLDGDGRIDAVVSAAEGRSRRLALHGLAPGAPLWEPESWTGSWLRPQRPASYMDVAVAQLDARHGRDIVAGSKSSGEKPGGIFWLKAPAAPAARNGEAWLRFEIGAANRTLDLEIADVDGDGDPDVLFSDHRRLGWYEHPGGEALEQPWPLHVVDEGRGPRLFARCDLDADGRPDLVSTTNDEARLGVVGRWYRALDDAGARWRPYRIRVAGGLPYGPGRDGTSYSKAVACGDLDADGRSDLAFAARGSGHGAFWLAYTGDSPRHEGAWTRHLVSARRAHVKYDNLVLADLDLDSDLDLVTTEESSGWLGGGLGVIWYENPHAAAP